MIEPVAADAEAVLEFWFGEQVAGFSSPQHRQRWFVVDPAFDETISTRFSALYEAAVTGALDGWKASPRGTVAFIIVTDQFPRNLFRGSARAFASDHIALDAARELIRAPHEDLTLDELSFGYMPFQHSEDLVDQYLSVGLFATLRDDTPEGHRHMTGNSLRFAQVHRDIIRRFGRFPHRNALLGRPTTAAERSYLETSDQDFGQAGPDAPST